MILRRLPLQVMEIDLRTVSNVDDARKHLDLLNSKGLEVLADLGIAEAPGDFAERFLEAHFESPETLLLVAESTPGLADAGVLLCGPQIDPLSGVRTPMILILSVDSNVRHRGLAATLVKEAQRLLGRRGYRQLAARCPHGDDALISMGERWGFVRAWEFLSRD